MRSQYPQVSGRPRCPPCLWTFQVPPARRHGDRSASRAFFTQMKQITHKQKKISVEPGVALCKPVFAWNLLRVCWPPLFQLKATQVMWSPPDGLLYESHTNFEGALLRVIPIIYWFNEVIWPCLVITFCILAYFCQVHPSLHRNFPGQVLPVLHAKCLLPRRHNRCQADRLALAAALTASIPKSRETAVLASAPVFAALQQTRQWTQAVLAQVMLAHLIIIQRGHGITESGSKCSRCQP